MIEFTLVNGRIVRACFKNNPTFAAFGDTEDEARANLLL